MHKMDYKMITYLTIGNFRDKKLTRINVDSSDYTFFL